MIYKQVIVFLLAIGWTLQVVAQDVEISMDSILRRADIQLRNRDYNAAFRSFNEATRGLYKLNEDDPIRTKAYYQCAKAFELIGANHAAIDYYQQAMETLHNDLVNYDYWKYHLIGAIGAAYMDIGAYKDAEKHFKEGIVYTKDHNPVVYQAAAHNNLGILYQKQNNHSEAISIFLAALDMIKTNTDPDAHDLRFGLRDNLAQSYLASHRFAQAKKILETTLVDTRTNEVRSYNAYLKLVHAELGLGNLKGAKEALDLAKGIEDQRIDLFDFEHHDLQDFSKTDLLDAELRWFEAQGDYQAAMAIQYRTDDIRDSLYSFQTRMLSSTLEALHEINILNLQSEIASKESEVRTLQQNKRLLFLSVFGLITIIILVFLLYHFRMKNLRVVTEIQNQLHEQKLKMARQAREEAIRDLQHRQQDMENLSAQYDYLARHQEQLNNSVREKLMAHGIHKDLIDEIIGKDVLRKDLENRFSLLRDHISTINQSFYSKLKQSCPSLTSNESELCAYLVMGISTKDIALMKNVAPESIKKAKYRLRKKFEIDPSTDLRAYIKSIV